MSMMWKKVASESDGCSSGPLKYVYKMLINRNYCDCCIEHDFYYRTSLSTRKKADLDLKECIEASGHPKTAKIMYAAVRCFGWMFYNK